MLKNNTFLSVTVSAKFKSENKKKDTINKSLAVLLCNTTFYHSIYLQLHTQSSIDLVMRRNYAHFIGPVRAI